MSSDSRQIAPDLWVGWTPRSSTNPEPYWTITQEPQCLDSATLDETCVRLSYVQMCALRRWFLGPDVPEMQAPACSEGGLETGGRARGAAPGGSVAGCGVSRGGM